MDSRSLVAMSQWVPCHREQQVSGGHVTVGAMSQWAAGQLWPCHCEVMSQCAAGQWWPCHSENRPLVPMSLWGLCHSGQ